ncbi:MAG: J domain-containing protein [Candidatus Vogelbacteria bacterium]|nr:J domain-containing protein [Candidatus Vogelbacteria bacterium]
MNNKDYYKILGVERNSSKDDIKKAFRKMAHKYHPDKNESADDQRFKEVNEAYQVLSDDKKRAEYDTYGRVFGDTAGAPPGGGFNGFDFSGFDFTGAGDFQNVDLGDIFSEFFGGGRARRQPRGRDISIDLQVSFADSIYGTKRTVLINKVGVCDECKGSGKEADSAMTKCTICGGKGRLREARRSLLGNVTTERTCDTCFGKGEIPKKPCKRCGGHGVAKRSEEIAITLPAGIGDGEMIRLTGRGESIPGGMAGDLYAKIHVEPHSEWRRDGVNLVMELTIKLSDALLGAEYPVALLDSSSITLKIPAGVSYGETLRVRGKGVPLNGKTGDLFVRLNIATPQHLSRKVRKLAEELREEGI